MATYNKRGYKPAKEKEVKEVKEFSEWFSDIETLEQLYDYIISQENKNQK